ncbi:MAG: chemotaxis protein CheW [Planctomycetota bacterium]|jgi:purine-binding chemotaxis protein CheW
MSVATTAQYCTFTLDGLFFGVDVLKVQEVIRYQEMTRIPGAPPVVSGLINLRGQLVTAVDLRHRLELQPRPKDQLPMNVVVRTEEGATSLLVDEIGDVIELDDATHERPPETIDAVTREVVRGVHKLDGRLLLVLDIEKLIASSGTGAAKKDA